MAPGFPLVRLCAKGIIVAIVLKLERETILRRTLALIRNLKVLNKRVNVAHVTPWYHDAQSERNHFQVAVTTL